MKSRTKRRPQPAAAWTTWVTKVYSNDEPGQQLELTAHGGTAETLSRRFCRSPDILNSTMVESLNNFLLALFNWANSFFQGGISYNVSSLVFDVISSSIGIAALMIAVFQIRKVRSSAEAASTAAQEASASVMEAAARVSRVIALVDMTKLCALSIELNYLIRQNKYGSASSKAQQLRRDLARAKAISLKHETTDEKEWQNMIVQSLMLHNTLDKLARESVVTNRQYSRCLDFAAKLDTKLHEISALAELQAGE